VIQNLGFFPDHLQNWITGSFCHSRHSKKISDRSVHNFLSYLVDTQTDRQTDKVGQKHNLLGGGNKSKLWVWKQTKLYQYELSTQKHCFSRHC